MRHNLVFFLALFGFLLASPLRAAPEDGLRDYFTKALASFQKKDLEGVRVWGKPLENSLLAPYALFWQAALSLDTLKKEDYLEVKAKLAGSPLARDLALLWLEKLGQGENWYGVLESAGDIAPEEKTDQVLCYTLLAEKAVGEKNQKAPALPGWDKAKKLSAGCRLWLSELAKNGQLKDNPIWARIRFLWGKKRYKEAQESAGLLPGGPDLLLAAKSPATILDNPNAYPKPLLPLAVASVAMKDHFLAQTKLAKLSPGMTPAERGWVWGLLAREAAKDHDPVAITWVMRASEMDDETLSWWARAAIREQKWNALSDAISRMDQTTASRREWRYWRAQAFDFQGQKALARALWQEIAQEDDFYGQLAREKLGVVKEENPTPKADDASFAKVRAYPALLRALWLRRAGQPNLGRREWAFALKDFSLPEKIAASDFAKENGFYDWAIASAEKAGISAPAYLYPTPFKKWVAQASRNEGLDEALVWGIIRQESRFDPEARSFAGARGLMQLMPATSRWVAKRLDLPSFSTASLTEVETNLALGTHYLRWALDLLGHPLLAAAGYNAGPGRPPQWLGDDAMPGLIYAESIPFDETRDYVKKVLGNASVYGKMMKKGTLTLSEWLGEVPGRGQ